MSKGYVYILTNPAMPGLVKIGKTTRTPEERAKQLSDATGVPLPFKVHDSFLCLDCDSIEARAHALLDQYRCNQSREFFSVPDGEDVFFFDPIIHSLVVEEVREVVEDILPGYIVDFEPNLVSPTKIKAMAEAQSREAWEVASSLLHLTDEEVSTALKRYDAAVEARKLSRSKDGDDG